MGRRDPDPRKVAIDAALFRVHGADGAPVIGGRLVDGPTGRRPTGPGARTRSTLPGVAGQAFGLVLLGRSLGIPVRIVTRHASEASFAFAIASAPGQRERMEP